MSLSASSPVERVLRNDRWLLVGGLGVIAALAWVYTLAGVGIGGDMTHNAGHAWTLAQTAAMLAMWWVMMIAMMVPSAAPTILLAAELNRRSSSERLPFGGAGAFAAGYLFMWLLLSIAAVAVQWLLLRSGMLTPMMQVAGNSLIGGLLLAAGLWQLTPVKRACLRHCQSPVDFLIRHRRPGHAGAFVVGTLHGAYCVGCCWILMALLFVGGVMNPYWIAGLTFYVILEKRFLRGEEIGQTVGIALIAVGLWYIWSVI